jgi:hypothetical protein
MPAQILMIDQISTPVTVRDGEVMRQPEDICRTYLEAIVSLSLLHGPNHSVD